MIGGQRVGAVSPVLCHPTTCQEPGNMQPWNSTPLTSLQNDAARKRTFQEKKLCSSFSIILVILPGMIIMHGSF